MERIGEVAESTNSQSFPKIGPALNLAKLKTPCFIVTVDTEEEFDWTAPFSRDRHGLTHLRSIAPFQKLCENDGVKPVYLVDYPVARDGFGAEIFSDWMRSGLAEVGLQLHPWVTPPFDEEVNAHNSYACNLPAQMERAKLQALYDAVVENIGVRPLSYRAGRYGAGQHTPDLLLELGIPIDTSVRSLFDYRVQGGPNFARCALQPYWVRQDKLIELPVTSIFGGALRSVGPMLFERVFESDSMRSLLARSGLLERIALTPEGIPAEKAILAIDLALEMDLPVLNFSFHSPSLAVGHTPYVRTGEQLDAFYDWWEQIFAHLAKRNVRASSMEEIATTAFAS